MKRVLLTRDAEDNAAWAVRLRALGFEPVELECISCHELAENAGQLAAGLARAGWLALASRRAVRAVASLHPPALPAMLRVACVGPETARVARALFGRADLVAGGGTGGALGRELAERAGREGVLVAGAADGRADVERELEARGVPVERVAVYRTVPASARGPRLRPRVDVALLASPSAVAGLGELAVLPARAAVVTLGPSTTEAARAAGLRVSAEAPTRDLEGLIAAIESLERTARTDDRQCFEPPIER